MSPEERAHRAEPCQCDPPGSGEEFCTGECFSRSEPTPTPEQRLTALFLWRQMQSVVFMNDTKRDADVQIIAQALAAAEQRGAEKEREQWLGPVRLAFANMMHSYHVEGTWREDEVHDEDCAKCILEKVLKGRKE